MTSMDVMSKLLYSIKIVLLGDHILTEMPKDAVFGAGQYEKIERFVRFVILCYVSWWLTAPVPAEAPCNDLALLKAFYEYLDDDDTCAGAAFVAFTRHLWYLTEELVLLAFFSSTVSKETKKRMVEELLRTEPLRMPRREGTGFGRPKMPVLPFPVGPANVQLWHFVGQDSWQFFIILGIDRSFLNRPVSEWRSDEGWLKGKKIVNELAVTNDAAERGVALAFDFLGSAKQETAYQNILQVVDNQRKAVPNQRRREKVLAKEWHLTLDEDM